MQEAFARCLPYGFKFPAGNGSFLEEIKKLVCDILKPQLGHSLFCIFCDFLHLPKGIQERCRVNSCQQSAQRFSHIIVNLWLLFSFCWFWWNSEAWVRGKDSLLHRSSVFSPSLWEM